MCKNHFAAEGIQKLLDELTSSMLTLWQLTRERSQKLADSLDSQQVDFCSLITSFNFSSQEVVSPQLSSSGLLAPVASKFISHRKTWRNSVYYSFIALWVLVLC